MASQSSKASAAPHGCMEAMAQGVLEDIHGAVTKFCIDALKTLHRKGGWGKTERDISCTCLKKVMMSILWAVMLFFPLAISGASTGLCCPWQPSTITFRTPRTHQSIPSPCSITSWECSSWHCLSVRLVRETVRGWVEVWVRYSGPSAWMCGGVSVRVCWSLYLILISAVRLSSTHFAVAYVRWA